MLYLSSILAQYEAAYKEASQDTSKYLANPINAFLIVKHLTADWKKVEELMAKNVAAGMDHLGSVFQPNNTSDFQWFVFRSDYPINQQNQDDEEEVYFPSDEDLSGAASALMRLQDTYQLDTHELAKGKLLGKQYSRELTGTSLLISLNQK